MLRGLSRWQRAGLVAGPIALVLVALLPSPLQQVEGYGSRPALAAGVGALMAIWWFTEALPIAWTAAVPLVLFPLLGVFGSVREGAVRTGPQYLDAYIFLFFGGMVIGAAMEQWNLHRRVALHIMRLVGTRPRRLLFGMLLATALVSMWISNTATAVMMVPIAGALVAQLEADRGGARLPAFGAALLLAVAYGANVGGIGTKIGTGTNSIFVGFVSENLGREIDFLEYMLLGVPFVALFLPVAWGVLWLHARRDRPGDGRGKALLDDELRALGPPSGREKLVGAVFLGAAVLWILADPIRSWAGPAVDAVLGAKLKGKHYEAGVSLLAALVLLSTRSVSAAALRRVPWGTLVLLGGSFALAEGIEGSGLATFLATRLAVLAELPLVAQLGLATSASIGLSAVASNTATVNVMLNVLPRSLPVLAASALASSCDFALPAGTPPNAIVFGSGRIRLPVMMRIGVVLDLLAALALTLYGVAYIQYII